MGLKIIRGRDGKPRSTWYGRIIRKGRVHTVNLNIPILGIIPTDAEGNFAIQNQGDEDFERSRRSALKVFDKWRGESKKDPAELQAKAYKVRTGTSLEGVPLAKLYELWEKQKRTYTPTDHWKDAVKTWFDRFTTFAAKYAAKHNGRCETVNDITSELVCEWFDSIKSEFAWETVTKQMSLMRGAFKRYATNGQTNPFEDIIMRNREVGNRRVNHRPLTSDELQKLFDCSANDELIHPLIVCAACTGMRIGDVSMLKQSDVYLKEGVIDVITAKAGVRATIPIFGRLRPILDERCAIPVDGSKVSPYVFPEAARIYKTNPSRIYKSIKLYFAQALAANYQPTVIIEQDGNPRSIADALAETNLSARRKERIATIYQLYKDGICSSEIATRLGVLRSQVSMDLQTAETITGEELRPRSLAHQKRQNETAMLAVTRQNRSIGKRAASIYSAHSLRATFAVLALTETTGITLADVQKVLGHSAVEMTLAYYNPTHRHALERLAIQMQGTVLGTSA